MNSGTKWVLRAGSCFLDLFEVVSEDEENFYFHVDHS
jgi:hypothetical protein